MVQDCVSFLNPIFRDRTNEQQKETPPSAVALKKVFIYIYAISKIVPANNLLQIYNAAVFIMLNIKSNKK